MFFFKINNIKTLKILKGKFKNIKKSFYLNWKVQKINKKLYFFKPKYLKFLISKKYLGNFKDFSSFL